MTWDGDNRCQRPDGDKGPFPFGTRLAALLGDREVAQQLGPQFTCAQANEVATILSSAGQVNAAIIFLLGHADHDTYGMEHFGMDDVDALEDAGLLDVDDREAATAQWVSEAPRS